MRNWTFRHLRDIVLERHDATQCSAYVGPIIPEIESPDALEEAEEKAEEEAEETEQSVEALADTEFELPKVEADEATEVAQEQT